MHQVHAPEHALGGARVLHVDLLEGKVAPAGYGNPEALAILVNDDVAGVVAEHQPVPGEEDHADLFDAAQVVQVQRPYAPVRGRNEPQTRIGGGEVQLVGPNERSAVGIAHDVRIPDADLAVVSRPEAGQAGRGPRAGQAEAVSVAAQD